MNIVSIIARQIILMFLYMGIGYLLRKFNLISKEGSKSLANLLLYCVLPAVIIKSFCLPRTDGTTIAFLESLSMALGLLLLAMVICALLFRRNAINNFSAAFSNAGFMGLPLISAVLGSDAVFYSAGFVALLNIFQWTYGQWLLSGDRSKLSLKAVALNPIILSFVGGILVYLLQLPIPEIAMSTLSALSGLNAPIAMITLGVYLAEVDIKSIFLSAHVYWVSIVRLVIIPVISIAFLAFFRIDNSTISFALLIAACAPVGSNVAVYAQKLNLDYEYAVKLVCLSTCLCIVTMPIVIAVAQCWL